MSAILYDWFDIDLIPVRAEYRNRLDKNILRLSLRGKPKTRPFLLLSRFITRLLHCHSLHLLVIRYVALQTLHTFPQHIHHMLVLR
jgi:hypothetical protein